MATNHGIGVRPPPAVESEPYPNERQLRGLVGLPDRGPRAIRLLVEARGLTLEGCGRPCSANSTGAATATRTGDALNIGRRGTLTTATIDT
jgi:hypothetical protein